VLGQHGSAATSHPLATQIAIDVLKKGGSAVDAAIAANAALGLMEPTGCGIGGDIFAIVWDGAKKELVGLNGSGRTPSNLTYEKLIELLEGQKEIPPYGPLPISVPGCVDGWFMLHERFGKLPFNEILQPTIDYATNGFPVTQVIANGWKNNYDAYLLNLDMITSNGQFPKAFEGFESTFLINGQTPKVGQIFKNPALAQTLQKIAQGGRDEFYKGIIGNLFYFFFFFFLFSCLTFT